MNDSADKDDSLQLLDEVKQHLREIPEFPAEELRETRLRIENRRYLVAVFGAFSAGKSSLLNALVGESMLVVSPNPTTASVTRMSAPSGERDIEAIEVTAKTEEELWRDVSNAFQALHETPTSLTEAMLQASVLNPRDYPTSVRSYIRFLKSVADGYDDMLQVLGTSWTTTIDHLKAFTTDEKQAAYIARVDVFRRNPWLNNGFIFVDTPGVDSIHRRHTDVAFRYMRHADAVLFVMYYTHAFTQRDRDFLIQLSGVQDVTQTNKLFTVVNAVDLATSDDERQAVRSRIEEELKKLGIRRPRVYEVSSQLALAGRGLRQFPDDEKFQAMARARANLTEADLLPDPRSLIESSGLLELEHDLQAYIESEGNSLVRDSVVRTLSQIRSQVNLFIADAEAARLDDAQLRKAKLEALSRFEIDIRREFEQLASDASSVKQAFVDSLQELMFHAGERIRLRYRDMFRQSFHPGRFRIGRAQDRLQDAAAELVDSVARQIDIETRTFSMRAAALVEETYTQTLTHWRDGGERVSLNARFQLAIDTDGLIAEDIRSTLPQDLLRPYFRLFSSPRKFFEDGGSQKMMDASETTVMEHVRHQLDEHSTVLMSRAWDSLIRELKVVYEDIVHAIQHVRNEASRPFDKARLEQLQKLELFFQSVSILDT